jgi:CheY-like chemotaxis protein
LSVLIVEPDPDTADTLADVLKLYGHRTQVARTCRQAGQAVLAFIPDVVLMELALPDGDGHWLAITLSNLLPVRPLFIVITGRQQQSPLPGFGHQFIKPVCPSKLAELLDKCAAERSVTQPPMTGSGSAT